MTEGFYTPPESPVSVHSPLQMRLHDIFKRDRGCISLDMGSVSTPCSPTGQSIVTRNVRKSGKTLLNFVALSAVTYWCCFVIPSCGLQVFYRLFVYVWINTC